MKKLFLFFALLFATPAFAQLIPYSDIVIAGSGRPMGGAGVSVCSPGLTTTGAAVSNNIATLTFGSSPITAGFANGMTLMVSGFTGGDTYFNSGSIVSGNISGGYTILSVTATTISFALTHGNASASSNGLAFQQGGTSQACAPLASIYLDPAGASPITQPGFLTDGIGNYAFYATAANYIIQFYGSGITTKLKPVVLPISASGNITFTGNNTHSGTETFIGNPALTATNSGTFNQTNPMGPYYSYANVLVNTSNCGTQYQTWRGGYSITNGLCVGVTVPVGATVSGAIAGNFQAQTSAASPQVSGMETAGYASVNNAQVWGLVTQVQDSGGLTTGVAMHAAEYDIWAYSPPSAYSYLDAIRFWNPSTYGQSISTPTDMGNVAEIAANTTWGRWANGFVFDNGAVATFALNIGAQGLTGNQNSQAIQLTGHDSTLGFQGLQLAADHLGTFSVSVPTTSSGVGFSNFSNTFWLFGSPSSTHKATFQQFNTADRTYNFPDASGTALVSGNGNSPVQTATAAGCTTAASIGGVCASPFTVTWSTAFADANYKMSCSPNGAATNLPSTPYIVTKSAGSVTMNYFAITAAAASWPNVECTAVHN